MRRGAGPDARVVSREQVLRHWLDRELRKRGEDLPTGEMDEEALLGALLSRTSGENRPLWRPRRTRWYHEPLTERRLRRLRTVAAPEGFSWRLAAPDESVLTAARRVRAGSLTDDTSPLVDVTRIRDLADRLPDADLADLVVVGGQTTTPPRVVDGNHRAVALALHLLRGGEMPAVGAYRGVVETPPLRLLVEKARWLARGHLRGRWW